MATKKSPQSRGLIWALVLGCSVLFGGAMLMHHAQQPSTDHFADRFDVPDAKASALSVIATLSGKEGQSHQPDEARAAQASRPRGDIGRTSAAPLDLTDKWTMEHADKGAVVGAPRVLSSNALSIDGQTFILWGILVPASTTQCTSNARSWACGAEAVPALANAIGAHLVACYPKGTDLDGNEMGTCFVGVKDLAGIVVEDGYGLADTAVTHEYKARQIRAKFQKLGMWASDVEPQAFVGPRLARN